jgi:small subunit ribosomal protein S18
MKSNSSSSNSNSKTRGPKGKAGDNPRKIKKKTSVLITEKVEYVDYKDTNLLQRFVSDRSKIRSRRVTGNDQQQQREITPAIKNAREMALLPYAKRVTTQRTGRGGDRDRGPRGDRGERGAPEVVDTAVVEAVETEVEEVSE